MKFTKEATGFVSNEKPCSSAALYTVLTDAVFDHACTQPLRYSNWTTSIALTINSLYAGTTMVYSTGPTYMVYRSFNNTPVNAVCRVELYNAFAHEAQPRLVLLSHINYTTCQQDFYIPRKSCRRLDCN